MDVRCVNHPPAHAVTTCSYCNTPLCEKCLFYHEGMVYCGQPCAIKAKSMGLDLRQKLQRQRFRGGFIASTFRTLIIVAILLGILDFLNIQLPFVPNFF